MLVSISCDSLRQESADLLVASQSSLWAAKRLEAVGLEARERRPGWTTEVGGPALRRAQCCGQVWEPPKVREPPRRCSWCDRRCTRKLHRVGQEGGRTQSAL